VTWIELVRYDMGLVIVAVLPGAVAFWSTIHGFVDYWRRIGHRWAYVLALVEVIACALALFSFRAPLMAVDLGTDYPLIGLGVPILVLGGVVARARGKHMKLETLVGLPELATERYPARLLKEGIYGRVRHPRYLEVTLFMVGGALIANYLATYVAVGFWLVALLCVLIPLEERELQDRFGAEYGEYRRRVPMIVPW